jgi:hypothetical protein
MSYGQSSLMANMTRDSRSRARAAMEPNKVMNVKFLVVKWLLISVT